MSVEGKAGKPRSLHGTKHMRRFCEGVDLGMSQTDAARYAGYKCPKSEGTRLMGKPFVIQRLAELKEMRRQATQNALNEEAREAVITRREVEGRFAEILKTGGSDSACVSAGMALARINGWIVNKAENITDRLKGKSPDELEFIAIYGRDPADASELHAFREIRRGGPEEGPPEASEGKRREGG